MVTIIEHDLQRKIKCKNCKALLGFTVADVEIEYIRMNENIEFILCPNCGVKIVMK